jgi:unsaturated chondroitin disaccharide hydrolase
VDYLKALSKSRRELFTEALDLLAAKLVEDEAAIGVEFPYVTEPDGAWRTLPASLSAGYTGEAWSHGNWFCGFWVGLLLAAHLHSGDARFLAWARERMQLVAPRAEDPNTHDIGFIFCGSALPGHHITGEAFFAELALRAANRLRARLVTTRKGAYIASWGPLDDPRGRCASAIDTMANIPLLYWAADHADDGSFRLAGEAHARMTRDAFIRPDDSTYHAVEYDVVTGARRRGYTFQGAANESFWSRGQGWAIYGFAASARATGKLEYLELAERLARRFLERLDDSLIPFWDFDDPEIPEAPRDTSASAIVAAALLDMAALHPDSATGADWAERAFALLEALCGEPLARAPGHRGLLKHGCYSKPHGDGVDSAVLFGDFYFVEGLCGVLLPGRFRPQPARLS